MSRYRISISYTVLLIVVGLNVYGQGNSNNIQELYDSSFYHSRYDYDMCIAFAEQAKALAIEENDIHYNKLYDYYIGVCANRSAKYDSAMSYFNIALLSFEELQDSIVLADIYYQMALIHRQRSEYLPFLDNIEKSQSIATSIGYNSKIGMCYNAKLIHYMERELFEKGLESGTKALDIFAVLRDSSSLGDVYNNMGVLLSRQGKLQEALDYHLKQHDLNLKINNVWGQGYSHGKLAQLYAETNQADKASYHISSALNITRTIGTPYELTGALNKSVSVHLAINDLTTAKRHALEAHKLSQSKGQQNAELDATAALIEVYKKQNNLDSVVHYQEAYIVVKDKVLNETIAQQVSELEIKYETAQNKAAMEQLALQDQLNETKISQQRTVIGGFIIGLSILSLQFYQLKLKNKEIKSQNQIIAEALDEKEILLKEIHHRVKNNLQVVSSLLRIQSNQTTDDIAIDALKEGQSRVQSMSLIHQNLYQRDNLRGINMPNYLDKLTQGLFTTYNIASDRITLKTDIQDLHLDVDTVVPLGLIINELVTNALKYAFPEDRSGVIHVSLQETDEQLILFVKDNGIGIDKTKLHDSFGQGLVQAFATKLEADITIENDNGTSISVVVNDYQVI